MLSINGGLEVLARIVSSWQWLLLFREFRCEIDAGCRKFERRQSANFAKPSTRVSVGGFSELVKPGLYGQTSESSGVFRYYVSTDSRKLALSLYGRRSVFTKNRRLGTQLADPPPLGRRRNEDRGVTSPAEKRADPSQRSGSLKRQ